MSIRRAVEYNMKSRLDEIFANTNFQVVESLRQEERPLPVIIVVSGDASPAFLNSDLTGNYTVPFNLVIFSSVDDNTVDEHSNAVHKALAKMKEFNTRRHSVVKYLYLYDVHSEGMTEDNQDRKMGTILAFKAVVNYSPEADFTK